MSAASDLAGYAGGDAVLAEANKVEKANPGAITEAATRLSTAATNVATDSGEVAKAVKGLDDAWEGTSADLFVAYMDRFSKAGNDVGQSMTQAANALKSVADAIDGAKTYISGRCEDALTEIRNWIRRNNDADQATIDNFTRGVCGDVVTDIQSKLKETESALSSAAGTIKSAQTPASTFDSMPDPNTQPFVPQPGQQVQWTPTPPGSTKPSGTDGQNGNGQSSTSTSTNTGSGSGSGSGGGSGDGGGGGGHSGGGGGGGMGSSGGPPAGGPPPGNVQEWIKQAIEILRQQGINVSDDDAQRIWQIIQHESGGNPKAINLWDCVPMSTMILTRRGWLKHDEVQIGDQTIGYRPDSGRSEWTRVVRVVQHANAPLIRIGNSRWRATTTPNHRWINLPRISLRRDDLPTVCPECDWQPRALSQAANGVAVHRRKMHGVIPPKQVSAYATEAGFVETQALRSRDRLLLAAPADTDSRLDVSVREAAVLGWIAGDGHVETRRHGPSMSIAQSKPDMVRKLRQLLDGIPHAVYADDRGGCGPRHQFRLDHRYAQDLLRRAGHPKAQAVEQVLGMSSEQRTAWLEALTDAEGTRTMRAGYTKPHVMIYQAPGAVLDAAAVATYLSGARPRVLHTQRSSVPDSWGPEASVAMNNPVVTGGFLRTEDAGRADVWCVTTELGTWTAREDEHIFLTGNSNAAAGHPSKGLMQCIDSTFNAHKLPGHDDIWNPVDNIIAGVRYSLSRYGSLGNVPGIKATEHGGHYVGY
jgi:uncharacterized protein YukE